MIPELKPDIYRCIGKHLAPVTTSNRLDDDAKKDTKAYQQNLLNLMKSSKMMYEIFAPQLYTKCSVGDLTSIYTGLNDGNAMLHQIRHLHIYSGTYNEEPTYTELIKEETWESLQGHEEEEPPYSATEEITACAMVANSIFYGIHNDRLSPFHNLRSVSLGGSQDHIWGSPMGKAWEEGFLEDTSMSPIYRTLPVALLAVPSVEHFCQSTESGPLALRPSMYKTSRQMSTKIFTYHLRHPDRYQGLKRNFAPIVSGATNRYYYIHDPTAENINVISNATPGQAVTVCLVKYFSQSGLNIVGPDRNPLKRSENDKLPVENTVIELYGLCPADFGLSPAEQAQTAANRTYGTREVMQEVFDSHVPEIWKGKVLFKNKAEAPPCTACGRKLMDE